MENSIFNKPRRNDEINAFRHSIAGYKLDKGIIGSESPEAKPRAKNQWFDRDLTPEGVKLAQEKAEKYLDTLNPETDALFFVSSDLVRAAETAKIFLDEAKKRGFEIIRPREEKEGKENQYRNKAEEIGEGEIRKINCLTLDHLENMFRESVFNEKDFFIEVVNYPENISEETKKKWKEARAIIENDNRKAWGDNYYAHSEAISKIFPNVKSAKEVYETKFKQMLRLVKFAQEKIQEQNPKKNIKILAFSHENSFIYFLNEEFGESIKNCESIGFRIGENSDEITVEAKGGERKFVESKENNWELKK